jgi:hypothetical protein
MRTPGLSGHGRYGVEWSAFDAAVLHSVSQSMMTISMSALLHRPCRAADGNSESSAADGGCLLLTANADALIRQPDAEKLSMKENPPLQSVIEQRRISLKHPHEVAFWTGELAATEAELREAVRKAGPKVRDVRRYLNEVWQYLGKLPPEQVPPQDYRQVITGQG